ncbi:hypothetical protein SDC9_171557 [bioreactor metagenome]|uniref:Uncharacterized protein n=1 Tax=bioreactor metagenome TaxID=1076179 RepID=A0A645GKC2_9ZZZZ
MEQSKINRINELAKKSKEIGLTPEELVEQKELRAEFIRDFRGNLEAQLDNVYIEHADGSKEKLQKKNP